MVRIERFEDPRAFFARVGGFLVAREAEHNLLLGFRTVLERDPHTFGEDDPYLAAAVAEDEIVGVAARTPPYNLVLSEIDDPSVIEAFADDLAGDNLPGVLGPVDAAKRFAELWTARTGISARVAVDERIYAADHVEPPDGVPGSMRPYGPDDRDLALEWIAAFFAEAMPGSPEADAEAFLARRTAERGGGLVLWQDGEQPVSLAGFGSATPNGGRIGPVYTPPHLRGRGYASALTAALTARLLEEWRFCFLFTNLANPTSNSIYQRIGYRPVTDVTVWRFEQG
jgi:predicted GNAT family acetyltransferase